MSQKSILPSSPPLKMTRKLGLLVLLTTVATGAVAGLLFSKDKEALDPSEKEMIVELPAAPNPANLVRFFVGPTATQSFFIDTSSLKIGEDRVVRYTLVTTSASGAKNISFEGIYCKTMEKKRYAFGHADGTWSRARSVEWGPIRESTLNRHHAALAKEYFCQDGEVAGTEAKLIEKLRADRL